MATVWLATDLKHRRPVAIKVLNPGEGRDRFLREIAIVAQLSHPHVLPLIDSGMAGDQLYYIVPFTLALTFLGVREAWINIRAALAARRRAPTSPCSGGSDSKRPEL